MILVDSSVWIDYFNLHSDRDFDPMVQYLGLRIVQ